MLQFSNGAIVEQMKSREITKISLLVATGVVLPSLFHLSGIPGAVFLPMHLSPLLGGFFLSSGNAAFLLGFILPLLNFFLTGMPPFPNFLVMMGELGGYGILIFFLYRKRRWGVFPSLFASLLGGRLISILGNWVLIALVLGKKFSFLPVLNTLFVISLPGIAIQVVLIPLIVKGVENFVQRRATNTGNL